MFEPEILAGVLAQAQAAPETEQLEELLSFFASVLIPFAALAVAVVLIWMRHRTNQAIAVTRAETRKQLLDKFTSGEDLARFVGSDEGRRLFEQWTLDRTDPRSGILIPMRIGIVLTAIGLALLGLSRQMENLLLAGVIVTAAGIGLLIAAWISHHLITKWYRATIEGQEAGRS